MLALLMVGLPVADARAGAVLHDHSLLSTVEYDSNAAFLPDEVAEAVWRGIVTPGYQLTWRDGSQELNLDAELRVQRSSDTRISFDREDPSASLDWLIARPRGELTLRAEYSEASTRLTEFDDTGVLFQDGTRRDASLGVAWDYALSERWSLGTSLDYVDTAFEDAVLLGFQSASAGLVLAFNRSPRFQPYLSADYTRQEPEPLADGPPVSDAELFSVGVGAQAQLSRRLSLDAQVSAISLQAETPALPDVAPPAAQLPPLAEDDGGGWNAGAELVYEGERTSFSANAARTSAPAGVGGFIEADDFRLMGRYRLSEYTTIGVLSGLRSNSGVLEVETRSASVWLERRLSPAWRLRAEAAYREQTGFLEGADADATLISVSLQYARPRTE